MHNTATQKMDVLNAFMFLIIKIVKVLRACKVVCH